MVSTGPPAGLSADFVGAHPWGQTNPANSAAWPRNRRHGRPLALSFDAEACERPVVAPRGVPRVVSSQASTSLSKSLDTRFSRKQQIWGGCLARVWPLSGPCCGVHGGATKFSATSRGVSWGGDSVAAGCRPLRACAWLPAWRRTRRDHLLESLSRDDAVLAELHAPKAPDPEPMPHRRPRDPGLPGHLVDAKEPNVKRAVHADIYRPEPTRPARVEKRVHLLSG